MACLFNPRLGGAKIEPQNCQHSETILFTLNPFIFRCWSWSSNCLGLQNLLKKDIDHSKNPDLTPQKWRFWGPVRRGICSELVWPSKTFCCRGIEIQTTWAVIKTLCGWALDRGLYLYYPVIRDYNELFIKDPHEPTSISSDVTFKPI